MEPWVITVSVVAAMEGLMEKDLEKRISPRHSIEGPITLHFTIGTPMEVNAHVLNCSEEGICFSSNKRLTPGTTILFKASTVNYVCSCKNKENCLLRSISMVTVKWCHESSQKGQTIYIMGATYIIPY